MKVNFWPRPHVHSTTTVSGNFALGKTVSQTEHTSWSGCDADQLHRPFGCQGSPWARHAGHGPVHPGVVDPIIPSTYSGVSVFKTSSADSRTRSASVRPHA